MDREAHWNKVYRSKPATDVSWYESEPSPSLEWITDVLPNGARVIDVGGGASLLVDRLLARRFDVAILDLSATALEVGKARLGPDAAGRVQWVVADVTKAVDLGKFDLWHDRAVFHFLTDLGDRRAYVDLAAQSVRPGGYLMIATFDLDGPNRCSDLEVCRYDATGLAAELGDVFERVRDERQIHTTPWGKPQPFTYVLFRRANTQD